MAGGEGDWLVADSEDEDAYTAFSLVNGPEASKTNPTSPDTSVIQTTAFTPDRPHTPPRHSPGEASLFTPPGGLDSTISNFTSAPPAFDTPSIVAPKPQRPRPRVVMKKAAPSDRNVDVASTSFSHISDHPVSTRQTNDSIHPATTTSFGFSEAIDDVYSSFDIAERAKMRSRKKSQPANKSVLPVQISEVIELTSDEDELTLKPTKRQRKQRDPKPKAPTRPRPKPTLKVKPTAVTPSGSPTSDAAIRPHETPQIQQSSSQLPPSTLATIPPSTPPPARESTPLSSPLVTTRKRKRIRPPVAEEDDEMDFVGSKPTEVSLSATEPPPFFAPSPSSLPTDSGVEIPPVGSPDVHVKKKQASSSKNGARTKAQNKGKRGKKTEVASAPAEVEVSTGVTQEPSTPTAHHNPRESHSPIVRNAPAKKNSGARKGKTRAIDSCEEGDEPSQLITAYEPPAKENLRPDSISPPKRNPPLTSTTPGQVRGSTSKSNSTPMSELIRRVNSQPSSPFPNAIRTYSPFLKSSRTMLSRIAPLHPNRRTPPPPPPRPPPPKKSKKQLEMEERIEEELAETVDGWSCLTDEERKALRKARIDAELGYE